MNTTFRQRTLSRRASTALAVLLAAGLAACTSGESSDAPEGERVEPEAPEETVQTVPANATMSFQVQETISTETHETGDVFTATLASDVIGDDGEVVVPAGTASRWMVTESSPDGSEEGGAVLVVGLEAVQLGDEWAPVDATVTATELETGAADTNTETAAKVAVGAAAGAILGQVIGRDTESTLTGAGVGAAVGTAVALTTRGSRVSLPEGSLITVRLDEAVTIR